MRSLLLSMMSGSGFSSSDDRYAIMTPANIGGAGNYPVGSVSSDGVFNIIPTDIYIEEGFMKIAAEPGSVGSGKQLDITLMRNGVDTEVSFSFFEDETESTYTPTTPFLLSEGDIIKYRITPINSPSTIGNLTNATYLIRTLNTNYYPILNGRQNILFQSTYRYGHISGSYGGMNTVSIDTNNSICTVNGTLKSLTIQLETAVSASSSVRFAVFKNKVITGLYVDLIAGETYGKSSVDIDVSKGDLLSIGGIKLTGSPASNYVATGVVFESDVDGEFPLLMGSISAYNSTTVLAIPILTAFGPGGTPSDPSNFFSFYINYQVKFRDLFVTLGTAPGAGKSRDFSLYKNGTSVGLDFTISDTDVSGNNVSDEIQFDVGDVVVVGSTPTGSPASGQIIYSGITCYLNPIADPPLAVDASVGCVDLVGTLQGGLDHLEGKEVVILADGEVIEGRTIVNGDFDPPLEHSYSTAYVGLRYISDLGILQPEID